MLKCNIYMKVTKSVRFLYAFFFICQVQEQNDKIGTICTLCFKVAKSHFDNIYSVTLVDGL